MPNPTPGSSPYSDSDTKSAVQKAIRRGQEEMAAAACLELLGRGTSLFRRLPVIGVEDVGWEFGAPIFYECKRLQAEHAIGNDIRRDVARLARALARLAKDKDAAGLAGISELRGPADGGLAEIETLAREQKIEHAMRLARHLFCTGHKKALWEQLLLLGRRLGRHEHWLISGNRARVSQSLYPWDEAIFIAASIMAVARVKPPRQLDLTGIDDSLPQQQPVFRWHVFDMHTAAGKMALAALIKKGHPRDRLTWQWFYHESAVVNQEIGSLYELERELRGFGGTREEWGRTRPLVKELVEWGMRQRRLPVPHDEE